MLSLAHAIKSGRLTEFVAQEEERGMGPADRKKLDAALRRLATTPQKRSGRTSRSSSGDGSSGK